MVDGKVGSDGMIHDGIISAWVLDDFITLQFPFASIDFFKEDWPEYRKHLLEICKYNP